jgi:hypothetical protein
VVQPSVTLGAVLADAVPYTGHTIEGRRVVLDVRGRVVVHIRVGLRRYRCETFDDLGPIIVAEAGRARITHDGRFSFSAGDPAQRLVVHGRLAGRRVRGTVRVTGTIATGRRCASATLRFAASRG